MALRTELVGATLPACVADMRQPPSRLYVAGELPRGAAVAVVGTRDCTDDAVDWTRSLARELAASGITVLSGGARGIDRAAHEGALDAGGRTVVVAPSGLDRPSPPRHAELFERVAERGGAVVSLWPPATKSALHQYFQRNELLAALADAVVLVQCPLDSGTHNTAGHARTLRRPLLVAPGPPWCWRSEGNHLELRRGARLLTSADDVLAVLAAQRRHAVPPEPAEPVGGEPPLQAVTPLSDAELSAGLERLLAAHRLDRAELIERLGVEEPRLALMLLEWQLAGRVESDALGRYTLLAAPRRREERQ